MRTFELGISGLDLKIVDLLIEYSKNRFDDFRAKDCVNVHEKCLSV